MTDMPGGQVTLADLFRVLTAIQTNLATMATKLEVIDNRNKTADLLHADHEKRLRDLEAFHWKLIGLVLVVPAIVGFLGAYLPAHLK